MDLVDYAPDRARRLSVERDYTLDQIAAELGTLSRDQRIVVGNLLEDFAGRVACCERCLWCEP